MPLRAREVADNLSLRQYSDLCSAIDKKVGSIIKFDVISIKHSHDKVTVLVCTEGGLLHTLELAA